jgi:hypothetical protein
VKNPADLQIGMECASTTVLSPANLHSTEESDRHTILSNNRTTTNPTDLQKPMREILNYSAKTVPVSTQAIYLAVTSSKQQFLYEFRRRFHRLYRRRTINNRCQSPMAPESMSVSWRAWQVSLKCRESRRCLLVRITSDARTIATAPISKMVEDKIRAGWGTRCFF